MKFSIVKHALLALALMGSFSPVFPAVPGSAVVPAILDAADVAGIRVASKIGKFGGLVIKRIEPTSPFADAGLEVEDEIVFINGVQPENAVEFAEQLYYLMDGGAVEVVVRDHRTGKVITLWVTL